MMAKDKIAVPTDKVVADFIRIVQSLGYPEGAAKDLVLSAVWLEKRRESGITSLFAYLSMTKDMPYEDRKPRKGSKAAICVPCPILAAQLFHAKFGNQRDLGSEALMFQGPVMPILMVPLLVQLAAERDKAVRLHTSATDRILVNENEIQIEAMELATWLLCDPECQNVSAVEFIEQFENRQAHPLPLERINLPRKRLDWRRRIKFD